MSSTPPGGPEPPAPPPVPPGYKPGDYIPYKDRDPANPTAVAGQAAWADQARTQDQAAAGSAPADPYRALYGYDAPSRITYASWGKRVLAYVFDSFLGAVSAIPFYVGYYQAVAGIEYRTNAAGQQTVSDFDISTPTLALMGIGALVAFAFVLYNVVIRQGRTGYTFGKTVVGIKLVGDRSGQPVGAGMSFVRQLAHIVDGLICYIGYLWPLWDAKRQTIGDKIVGTVVIVQPQEGAPAPEA